MAVLPAARGATPPTLAYVTGRDGVTVIDTATDTVIDTISGCANAAAVAVSGSRLYVPCGGGVATLTPTDANGMLSGTPIVLRDSQVAITPNGEFLFVTTSKGVSRFDTTTHELMSNVKAGISRAVAISPSGGTTFVQTWNGSYEQVDGTVVPVIHVIAFATSVGWTIADVDRNVTKYQTAGPMLDQPMAFNSYDHSLYLVTSSGQVKQFGSGTDFNKKYEAG